MSNSDPNELRRQVNKRLLLNLLIQGAATHNYMTGHHLVNDELESCVKGLVGYYDRMTANLELALWMGEMVFFFGTPKKFWRDVDQPDHPFSEYPFFAKHAYSLSMESRANAVEYARKRWASSLPIIQWMQTYWYLFGGLKRERKHLARLEELAVKVTTQIWGIDAQRIDASLTRTTQFGNLQPNPSRAGKVMQDCAAGYSGVRNNNGKLKVVAKAWVFPLLIHELTKGVAELVCVHGLNQIQDDDLYNEVIEVADKIEYEIWMMQSGSTVWRKFLAAKTNEFPLADTLQHVAMLEPEELEMFMIDLIEHPMTARATVADWFEKAWSN